MAVGGASSSAAEGADARRARESRRVDERARAVATPAEFDAALALAEDRLVIVEAFSQNECNLGDESDLWSTPTFNNSMDAHEAMMEPCSRLHSTISRVAREADEVEFVLLDVTQSESSAALAKELQITTFPTVRFYKNASLLHEVKGAGGAGRAVGEGALYFGDQGAQGERASEHVSELNNAQDLDDFVNNRCDLPGTGARGVELNVACEKQLAVVNVSMVSDCPACMHIYPAVVAMAKNTVGAVRWARLLVDKSNATREVAAKLGVAATPTFLFYIDGKLVGTATTGDRVKLMEMVLETQQKFGVQLPQPPPRKRMSTAEAKEIARQKREAEKLSKNNSMW